MPTPGEQQPGTAAYIATLEQFEIQDHNAVLEPLRIEDGRYIVFISRKDMWATWKTLVPVAMEAEKILARATFIQSIPINYPNERDHLAFRRIIGSGIVQGLTGDYDGAEATLGAAESYAKSRAGETSRLWYVQASVAAAVLLATIGCVTELPRGVGGGTWEHFGMAMTFGAFGALFSFLSRLRKMDVDPASGRTAHYIDATVRILLGALGAFLFAVGIRADFVLGFTNLSGGDSIWLLYVFCTAAGASERLVPDFLEQVETRGRNSADPEGRPGVDAVTER